jgi:hypothetical protein
MQQSAMAEPELLKSDCCVGVQFINEQLEYEVLNVYEALPAIQATY